VAAGTPRTASGQPTVSIITPTLNQARYLRRTIDSVAAQTVPVSEHIVVDGGSTDGTVDILRTEAGRRPIRWTSEPDAGMYDAVNKGLALARGEILAYLASDDAYLPWAIEAVVDAFSSRPGIELLYGDGITIEEDSGKQILRLYAPFDPISQANYASLLQPAVFWRRGLYERLGGFDASLRYVGDLDYWLRAAADGASIAHLDEVLAIERVHGARLSAAQKDDQQVEEQAMRARRAGVHFGGAARQKAAKRFIRWQRWLWLRFLLASTARALPVPWRRFLRDGQVNVHRRQVLRGMRPRRHPLWRGAIESRLAAEILAA
jgi:glycosyltransferase involved in cell wall biosynthesis